MQKYNNTGNFNYRALNKTSLWFPNLSPKYKQIVIFKVWLYFNYTGQQKKISPLKFFLLI